MIRCLGRSSPLMRETIRSAVRALICAYGCWTVVRLMSDDAEARSFLDKEAEACEGLEFTDYDFHIIEPLYQAVTAVKQGRADRLPRIYEHFMFLAGSHKNRQEILYYLCWLLLIIHEGGEARALGEMFGKATAHIEENGTALAVKAMSCYLRAVAQEDNRWLENLLEAQKLAKACEQPLILAKVNIALGKYYQNENRFHSLRYYTEAQKITEELLENVPYKFQDDFVSRHKLSVPVEALIEDADVWASARASSFARLPEKCETPEDVTRLMESGADQNLSLIARFLAASAYADRSEIITEDDEREFAVLSSDDGDLGLTCEMQTLKLEEDILTVTESAAYICVPAVLDNTVLGYIYLHAGHRFHKINADSLRLCKRLAPLAAVNILQVKIRDGAFIDRLTGALNNKAFDRLFERIITKARETNGSFALIICDLDRFKSVNDTYGHQTGDEILRAAGRIFRGSLPADAYVGRIGGDEFAFLLDGCDSEKALRFGETVRRTVDSAMLLGSKRPVTVSMGISIYGEHAHSKTGLKKKADTALYICKERGRNGAVLYEPEFSDGKTRRFGMFDGIVTNDALRDSERMRFMLSLFELLRVSLSERERRRIMLNRFTEIMHADTGVWLEPHEGGFKMYELAYGVSSGYASIADAAERAGRLYEIDAAERTAREREWKIEEDEDVQSLYAPVIRGGGVKAVICLTGKPGEKIFHSADGIYLQYLCGLAATT